MDTPGTTWEGDRVLPARQEISLKEPRDLASSTGLEDSRRPAAWVARPEHPTGSSDALRRYGMTVAGRFASGTGRVGSRIDDQSGNHAVGSFAVVWHDVS